MLKNICVKGAAVGFSGLNIFRKLDDLRIDIGMDPNTGFFKTCEQHDDLKTLSEMKAYLGLRKSLLRSAAEAQERFNEGSRERYNKRARLRERTKAHSQPPNND